MAKKKPADADIYSAAMRVAADLGWRKARLTDIADEAGLTLAELHEKHGSKSALLGNFVRHIDQSVLKHAQKSADPEASYRDRLFDIVMHRFDALLPYKDGIRAIVKEGGGGGVGEFLCSGQRVLRSMRWMLEAADVSTAGFIGNLRVKGLAVVYAATVNVWLKDDSEDMAKTMAALDKNLSRAEKFATMQNPFTRRRDGDAGPDVDAEAAPAT